GVQLLHVADRQRGLRLDPGAQADLEGAVRQRIERTERQPGAHVGRVRRAFGTLAGHEDRRLLLLHRHDRGGEPDLDRGERGVGHGGSVARRDGERRAIARAPPRSLRLAAFLLGRSRYCFSGTVTGLPLSTTRTASTLAGSVWLALAETACNW